MEPYVSILGDSISSFFLTIPLKNKPYYPRIKSRILFPSQMWWAIMIKLLHWKLLVNESISGSCVAEGYRELLCASSPKRCLKLHRNKKKPDVIIIAMGVNDYTYNVPLEIFRMAYMNMLVNIKNFYKESKIICVSPWFTQRGKMRESLNGERLNNLGCSCSQYSSIIEELTQQFNLIYYDAELIGFSEYNYYPTYCCDNKINPTHPNRMGHMIMGEKLAQFINDLMIQGKL